MNIFYTNPDPIQCAREHCTVHTRKMIIEYAQMLCTAHRVLDGDYFPDKLGFYKKTHENHPSSKWVRECFDNYDWLYSVYVELCKIYEEKTGKVHASSRFIGTPLCCPPLNIQPRGVMTEPPMAMPDEFKSTNRLQSYQNYIKSKYNDWSTRERKIKVEWYTKIPDWV